jgi:subtilisin-like proprotein convertase family protein
MKRRLTRLAAVGIALGLVSAAGTAPASAKTVTKTATFNQCVNASSPIFDHTTATASAFVNVPKNGKKVQQGTVTAFNVAGTFITHTYTGDLELVLVSPGGKVVALAADRGSSDNGYGSGSPSCTGPLVQFSDAFGTPIADVSTTSDDPITGQFKPEQPLSGFVGGPARGFWTLVVTDCCDDDIGILNAFSLNFTYSYKKPAKKKGGK